MASATLFAQINMGEQKAEATLPFTMTTTSTFGLPWRIAFLPDGRMLVTEKIGPVWLVGADGQKISPVNGTPAVYWQGQNGMHGVFLSPRYATDQSIYLTYAEPGDYGGGLALARARLNVTPTTARLSNYEVIWRQMPRGKGGQEGAQVAFSPDGEYLFLTVGERQRFTPAQDPDQPAGKILRLTLDGKPAPDNPELRQDRRRHDSADRSAAGHRSGQDGEAGQHLHLPQRQSDACGNVGLRRPDSVRSGLLAHRRALGSRARPARRRRAEPDREGQELRLAAGLVRDELQRRADSQSRHAA